MEDLPIAVIEDDSAILTALKTALSRAGFKRLHFASHADSGLALIEREKPALLLLDLTLPDLDGLLTRIGAILRKSGALGARNIESAGLVIDLDSHEAILEGRKLSLTPSEFGILELLMSNKNRVFTRAQIIDAVQGEGKIVTDRTVDVQMVGLRRKLGQWSDHIETIRGVGYRYSP